MGGLNTVVAARRLLLGVLNQWASLSRGQGRTAASKHRVAYAAVLTVVWEVLLGYALHLTSCAPCLPSKACTYYGGGTGVLSQ